MRYFPIFLDISDKPVLVVGGGEVACRKIDALLRAGADVTVVSPQIAQYIQSLVDKGECRWVQNFYSSSLLCRHYVQVWATTDNPNLNHQVHKDAKALGILVNVVDDLPYCDFITPSMIERGRIQIAISSGGASPVLIRNLRELMEATLPQNMSLLADFCASKRNSIKQQLPTVDERRRFWEGFLQSPRVKNAKDREALEDLYQNALSEPLKLTGESTWIIHGRDIELIPMKALRHMQQADLVLFEAGCPKSMLDLARRDAERESFRSPADLAEKLRTARLNPVRICIFIQEEKSAYHLLRQQDRIIAPGSERQDQ